MYVVVHKWFAFIFIYYISLYKAYINPTIRLLKWCKNENEDVWGDGASGKWMLIRELARIMMDDLRFLD